MAKNVLLHGGPWHGRMITVQDGVDHFHIVAPAEMQPPEFVDNVDPNVPPDATIKIKRGTYSQVAGPHNRHDYEWDGWVDH